MTQIRSTDLLKGDLQWNVVGGKQLLVTYEHSDQWTGPAQSYVGESLPKTMQKLIAHAPLKIVAFGDSITFGLGSSRMMKIPPLQAPWIELFTNELSKIHGDPSITLYNSSQSGADSNWARAMAQRMVASLDPDLVLIAFGQNDFWSVSPATFASNISAIIQSVRSKNPNAEFLLVSTMRFDPVYSADATYWDAVSQYDARLRALTGAGVQLVDMTDISGAVFAAKSPKDCLNDPLHPNDYLSRWYAQSAVAALSPVPAR
jgi:lysophospholipase L1-like esterase